MRGLDVLASKPSLVWTRALLAHASNLDVRTVRRLLPRLIALGIVRVDKEFGVLALNVDHPVVQALLRFHEALAAYEAPKRAADG